MRNEQRRVTLDADQEDLGRVIVYRLLSDLFAHELTAEKICGLAKFTQLDLSNAYPCLTPLFAKFEILEHQSETSERELAGEFAYLFLGVGGRNSAPPYESAYRSAGDRADQHPTALMKRELAKLDLHVQDGFPEPSDHIAVALAFAAAMIEADADPEHQSIFLRERLHSWLPDFVKACTAANRSGFYELVAHTTARFIAEDLKMLSGERPQVDQKEDHNAR